MPEVKFFVAGTGDQSNWLKERVKEAGLEQQVEFTGFIQRDKVSELLASADSVFYAFRFRAVRIIRFGSSTIQYSLRTVKTIRCERSAV
jgi:glycosyltransferase involved in cell wall biosynthesis